MVLTNKNQENPADDVSYGRLNKDEQQQTKHCEQADDDRYPNTDGGGLKPARNDPKNTGKSIY